MVLPLKKIRNNIIKGDLLTYMREFELSVMELARDYGFEDEIMFPSIVPISHYSHYAFDSDKFDLLIESNSNVVAAEYNTIIKFYMENIWKEKYNFPFYYSSKVASYKDRNKQEIEESYIIGFSFVRPDDYKEAYHKMKGLITDIGKILDSNKGFTLLSNTGGRTIDFRYNGSILGFIKSEDDYIGGIINLTECAKKISDG